MRVRHVLAGLAVAALLPGTAHAVSGYRTLPSTNLELIHYRAHGGDLRSAWLLVPVNIRRKTIPLVISPHGRGTSALANMRVWGELPGLGDFAVINPAGEGRRLKLFSWGYAGQIDDLARMPQIAKAHGVPVALTRVYAIGGSMGGQETLLLLAKYPHLLAGAAAFDPDTDMARRYWDFARLPGGAVLQRLAREEVGGTPLTDPRAYAFRSPDAYARQIALSGVPLQLWWSSRDRVISDQVDETGALAEEILGWNPKAPLIVFRGTWRHTAEMKWSTRLPVALIRFHLLRRSQAIQV
ncbi:MAG TPA: hypothetical protein VGL76_04400 [Gaiellaceae bacterium]